MSHVLHLIDLSEWFIYDQLCLEEYLLRHTSRNYCIINRGSSPAVVMGIGTDVEKVVERSFFEKDPIPLIQRFSGGGTVVIDEQTFFVTLLFQKETVPIEGPADILRFGEKFYRSAFDMSRLVVASQDYTLDGKSKIGGNAHYISHKRWLSHTSFLWDFDDRKMSYLKHPPKEPEYRQGRSHLSFLERISSFYPSCEYLIEGIYQELSRQFDVIKVEPSLAEDFYSTFSTKFITLPQEAY